MLDPNCHVVTTEWEGLLFPLWWRMPLHDPHNSTRSPCTAHPAGFICDLLALEPLEFRTRASTERQSCSDYKGKTSSFIFSFRLHGHAPLPLPSSPHFSLQQVLQIPVINIMSNTYHSLKFLQDTPTEASSGLEASTWSSITRPNCRKHWPSHPETDEILISSLTSLWR